MFERFWSVLKFQYIFREMQSICMVAHKGLSRSDLILNRAANLFGYLKSTAWLTRTLRRTHRECTRPAAGALHAPRVKRIRGGGQGLHTSSPSILGWFFSLLARCTRVRYAPGTRACMHGSLSAGSRCPFGIVCVHVCARVGRPMGVFAAFLSLPSHHPPRTLLRLYIQTCRKRRFDPKIE